MKTARTKKVPRWLVAAIAALLIGRGGVAVAADSKSLIQIAVEVVEVNEQRAQKLGIDWLSQLHVEEASVPALFEVGALTRSKIFSDLHLMMNEGTADLLANPKLVTLEGSTATFHAGGELPYAVAGTLGTVTIEFKPYGVELKIAPRLDGNGRIALAVEAEVSGPDEQNSVSLAGHTVPGIRSRRVNSQLSLASGSTLTMAGMIQNQKETVRRGVPGLMHIPVLGYLFSHKTQTNRRTSIVVFLTPSILSAGSASVSATPVTPPSPLDKSVAELEKEDRIHESLF